MTDSTDFLSQAWHTLVRAIAETGVKADLYKTPETIAKSLNRRVRAELKRLAMLLRRLIFLIALQMKLAPLKPRIGSNYYDPRKADAEYRYIFTMVPAPSRPCPHFMKGPVTVPLRGPVPAAPLIARWQAMLDTLKHHKRRARRLARTIQRCWQAAGEARPHVPPIPHAHRMPAAIALVSGGLTVQLIEALKDWPSFSTS
ncbi:MAG: hypothetical protein KDA56_14065 [Hyphomonas sp.]|nr:hypothetical protein [Hyphomonas sp.]